MASPSQLQHCVRKNSRAAWVWDGVTEQLRNVGANSKCLDVNAQAGTIVAWYAPLFVWCFCFCFCFSSFASWPILVIRLPHFVVIMPSASFSRNYCHTYSCLACFSVARVLGVFFISSSRSFLRRDCSKPSDGAAFSSQQFSWSNTFQTWKQGGLCLTLDKSPKPNAVMEPCSAKTKSGFIAINDVFSFKTKTRAKKAPRVCSVCLLWRVARMEIVD